MKETMKKHAYMIMAHKNDFTFHTLLSMLDHPQNDIYVHMDIKNKGFQPAELSSYLKHSNIYLTERISITWGGHSQNTAKYLLLKKAREIGGGKLYSYYHFISGEDLPIQTQNYIQEFFVKHSGKEFVHFEWAEFPYQNRVRYYYFFQEKAGRGRSLCKWIYRGLDRISVACQKMLGVWRNPDVPFQKGEAWVSITGEFADYILDHWAEGEKWLRYTLYGDEELFQTFAVTSHFKDRLYLPMGEGGTGSIMRLIDWQRGEPYVFRMEDWEELRDSQMLWARKFDERVDSRIIQRIWEYYTE